ncbi:C6 transcription factor [Colletotrichum tofieldiae]|nr:C6 transcription factor [Colletotrichum tofieldiae]
MPRKACLLMAATKEYGRPVKDVGWRRQNAMESSPESTTIDLGEPELNDRGQPVIHNIAQKLRCIRPNSNINLPVHSVFPEDKAGLTELARQLEEQKKERNVKNAMKIEAKSTSSCKQSDRASSSEINYSDFKADYRKAVFGGHNNPITMSPHSFSTGYTEFDVNSVASPVDPTAVMF